MESDLRRLIARHLYPAGVPFRLAQTGPGTYDAAFAGDTLPSVNYDGLQRHLSAKAAFSETATASGYNAAVFEGYYKGQRVRVSLRATGAE